MVVFSLRSEEASQTGILGSSGSRLGRGVYHTQWYHVGLLSSVVLEPSEFAPKARPASL